MQHAVAAVYAAYFAVSLYVVGDDAGIPQGEGYGLLYVGANLYGCGMVRHYGYAYRLAPTAYLLEDGAHDASVEVFDGLQLQL